MRKNDWRSWLKSWDEGSFDFTAAMAAPDTVPEPEAAPAPHAWKERPVEQLAEGEIRAFIGFYPVAAVLLDVILVSFLLLTVAFLPPFGAADSPAHNEVMTRYVGQGMAETGAVNTVAGVILDYRAFDTLGESHVLYVGAMAVFLLLQTVGGVEPRDERRIMRSDPLVRSSARILVPMVLVYGIYVIFNGHLGPGGGFAGGAVIGSGLILYAMAFGFPAVERLLNWKRYRIVVLCALCFYSIAKCYSFFCGANHLHSIFGPGTPGRIFSAGLIVPLNVAVGLVVACTMYGLYSVFQRGKL